MHRQRFLFPALFSLTFWRLALLPTSDLAPQEAMAAAAGWGWGGAGPVLSLLARAGMLAGGHTEFGVRFFAPLLALAASYFVWRLAREIFDEQTAAWSMVMLNVLPAFNLAAIHLTPATVSFAATAGLAWSLTVAVRHAGRWHRAWLGAAACMAVAGLADGGQVALMVSVVLGLYLARGGISSLVQPEFWIVAAAWAGGFMSWVAWNAAHQWPGGVAELVQPDWRILPGVLRWVLLASPVFLFLLARDFRAGIRAVREKRAAPPAAFLTGMTLPLALADFGWSVRRAWPDAGDATWLMFASLLLVHRLNRTNTMSLRRRVSLRTLVIVLAAIQSLLIMRTDVVRSAGLPWAFAQKLDEGRTWSRCLSADPAGSANGWRETAAIVKQIIASDTTAPWDLIASSRDLSAALAFYALDHAYGTVASLRPGGGDVVLETPDRKPVKLQGRALYITDDERCKAVPAELAGRFKTSRILTIALIKHGGHQVRTVKIFACLP